MEILNDISTLLQQGRAPKVKEKVQEALDQGISAGYSGRGLAVRNERNR